MGEYADDAFDRDMDTMFDPYSDLAYDANEEFMSEDEKDDNFTSHNSGVAACSEYRGV